MDRAGIEPAASAMPSPRATIYTYSPKCTADLPGIEPFVPSYRDRVSTFTSPSRDVLTSRKPFPRKGKSRREARHTHSKRDKG